MIGLAALTFDLCYENWQSRFHIALVDARIELQDFLPDLATILHKNVLVNPKLLEVDPIWTLPSVKFLDQCRQSACLSKVPTPGNASFGDFERY
jgi:hypothetical protein